MPESFSERLRAAVEAMNEEPGRPDADSPRAPRPLVLVLRCLDHPEHHLEQPEGDSDPVLVCPHPGCPTAVLVEVEEMPE